EPLQRPERDQLRHVLADPAERRADEEDHDRRLQDDLAAVEIAELPVHRPRDGRGEEVGGDDPREVLDAAEVADDRRQRRRDDRLVERREEQDEQQRGEDQPHALRWLGYPYGRVAHPAGETLATGRWTRRPADSRTPRVGQRPGEAACQVPTSLKPSPPAS